MSIVTAGRQLGRGLRSRLLAMLLTLAPSFAEAQGRYFNISLQGSYQRSASKTANTTRTSLSAELAVPLTDFLEISAAQGILQDETAYSDLYRNAVIQKMGWNNLPKKLVDKDETYDTSINAGLGYPIGFVKPSLFGGKLWRKVCSETFLEDQGCSSERNSWNVGISLAIYVTQSLRLRTSYRVSPSARSDGEKTYDDATSVGLTWGY